MFLFQKDFFGLPVSNVTTGESSRLGTSCSIVLNCVPSAMTRSLAASLIFFDKAGLSAHLWLNEDYIFSHKEIKIANKTNFLMIFCLRSNMDEWSEQDQPLWVYPLASDVFRRLIPEVSCDPSTGNKNIHIHIPATTSFLSTCMSRITNIFTISMSILSTGTVWKPNFDLIWNNIKLLSTYGQNKDILKEKKMFPWFLHCTTFPSILTSFG